eukprot:IDg2134t1
MVVQPNELQAKNSLRNNVHPATLFVVFVLYGAHTVELSLGFRRCVQLHTPAIGLRNSRRPPKFSFMLSIRTRRTVVLGKTHPIAPATCCGSTADSPGLSTCREIAIVTRPKSRREASCRRAPHCVRANLLALQY